MPIQADVTKVGPGERLYVFSDGAFEIEDREGTAWRLDDFRAVVLEELEADLGEPERLYRRVCDISGSELGDDFSMVTVHFR